MKEATLTDTEPEMRAEYDFSNGVRGRLVERFAQGTNIVVIAPEIRDIFPDSESVNEALRPIAALIRARTKSL